MYNIREAQIYEIETIAALHISNQKETYRGLLSDSYLDQLDIVSEERKWREYLEQRTQRLIVAYEGSMFLGFAACKPDPECAEWLYLDSLHVSPEARGIGVGTVLIKWVMSYAEDHRFERMTVCIVRGNELARNLYFKMGAVQYRYFIDRFDGTTSNSEKLWWDLRNASQRNAL